MPATASKGATTGRAAGLVAAVLASLLLAAGCTAEVETRPLTPAEQHIYLEPTALPDGGPAYDRIAMGYDHACMLTADGQAWCWGSNSNGQLGAPTAALCSGGTIGCSWQAVRAVPPLRFVAFSAGMLHGCGIDAGGQAWCWGFGQGGQLGDGMARDSATAVPVAGGHHFVQIDAGRSAMLSCALDDAAQAWCWGPMGGGLADDGSAILARQPQLVSASVGFVAIGAGDEHGCALDGDGQVWCWGHNAYGKLGRGVSGAAQQPALVAGGHRFAALAVGGQFNCALDTAGQAWCWGFALSIGDGADQHRNLPTAVAGGHVFVQLRSGYQHSCGLTADGSAWCWGMGVLTGSGSQADALTPVAVAGGHRFRTLGAGGMASCGLRLDGLALCWGMNNHGSVGQANVDP